MGESRVGDISPVPPQGHSGCALDLRLQFLHLLVWDGLLAPCRDLRMVISLAGSTPWSASFPRSLHRHRHPPLNSLQITKTNKGNKQEKLAELPRALGDHSPWQSSLGTFCTFSADTLPSSAAA